MSKGSKSRISNKKRYDQEYERIYGEEDFILKARKSFERENGMHKLRNNLKTHRK